MNKMNPMQRFLIWAGGFDAKTLTYTTSSEITKMSNLGSMVLIPALIGMFSFGYAVYLISEDRTLAVIGGLVWAIVIFIIDRGVMSHGKPGELNLGLIGRLCLAVTIGLVIAEPIILLCFKDAIQEQQYAEAQEMIDEVNEKYDTKVEAYKGEIDDFQARVDDKQEAYIGEMDGTGGSGIRDQGPIYEKKLADYQSELERFQEEKSRLDNLIEKAETDRSNELNNLKASMGNGLLSQISALHKIDSWNVFFATWILRLFFFFIELVPFFMKITPGGRLYYETIDRNDEEVLEVRSAMADERKAVLIKRHSINRIQELLELNKVETKAILSSKKDHTIYLMDQLNSMTDKKLSYQLKIIKRVTDETERDTLLKELDNIFNGYIYTVEKLLEQSNNFHAKTAE